MKRDLFPWYLIAAFIGFSVSLVAFALYFSVEPEADQNSNQVVQNNRNGEETDKIDKEISESNDLDLDATTVEPEQTEGG